MQAAAEMLSGLTLDGGWEVLDRLPVLEDRTAPTFSVGYIVRGPKGEHAFCKAIDWSVALAADDPAEELQRVAAAYIFERDLLERCHNRRMSKVVHAISSGTVRVSGAVPPTVNYLIFQKADADSRDILAQADVSDYRLALQLVKDCSVALGQLHRGGVTHQDVKPANLLGWQVGHAWDAKLGDLGRAFCETLDAPHNDLECPGDTTWSAPELLYGWPSHMARDLRSRQLADLYSLGSLMSYSLFRVPYGGLLAMHLEAEHRWSNWQGGYPAARSFLIDAHERSLERLEQALPPQIRDLTLGLLEDMCHPVLDLRGKTSKFSSFVLERYISKIDVLAKRASLLTRAGQG